MLKSGTEFWKSSRESEQPVFEKKLIEEEIQDLL